MYTKGTGQKVKIEGVAYLIFKEGEILATLGE
jgi:co-chaperonin GroES (HSP10)